MGAQGTTTVNFGAFPGKTDVTVTITGQAGIVTGSLAEAWIRPAASADHTVGEHVIEPLRVVAHSIVAGVGFDITVFTVNPVIEPLKSGGAGQRGVALLAGRTIGYSAPERGGRGSLVYGEWNINWVWN